MLWAVGLRGAVAYGLVINLPRADDPTQTGIPAIETATLFIVVVTTLGLGSATGGLADACWVAVCWVVCVGSGARVDAEGNHPISPQHHVISRRTVLRATAAQA